MVKQRKLLRVLNGIKCDPPPVWLMRQAGRYLPEYRKLRAQAGSFLKLCYTPELAAEVTLQPIRRFGFDAAILFSDILIVPHALGQELEFREGEGPVLEPVQEAADLKRLSIGSAGERFEKIFETVARVSARLPRNVAMIGFCGAPWTVATYMVAGGGSSDQEQARAWAYCDPVGFQDLIDIIVEASLDYLAGQIEAGAHAIQIFDSWAGNLPDDEFRRWSIAPCADIIRRLKVRFPDIPVIGFPRVAGPQIKDFAMQTGVDAISCDTALSLDWIRQTLQPNITIQGNLDPVLLAAGGQALEARIGAILDALADRPFIFNLGHGILPNTPLKHVTRLVELIKGRVPANADAQ